MSALGNRSRADISISKGKLSSIVGITLLELLSVIVIVGILAAMAVPRFQIAMERFSFNSANRRLVSTLRLARSYAMANKAHYGVYFNGTFNNSGEGNTLKYTLFLDVIDPEKFRFDTNDSVIRVDTLTPGVTYMDTDLDNDVVIFLPNGSARFTGGGNIVIMAMTPNIETSHLINVLRSTGRVEMTSNDS